MCGIAGILSSEPENEYGVELQKMLDTLRHRGPDGQGVFKKSNANLGHRRLSIVDIGGGHQPMRSMDEGLSITFNGEIYGFKDLKSKYSYPYQNQSDTELILAMYSEHGVNMLRSLPGMFSFALWDEPNKMLFCARDRFGEKPFFYAISDKGEFVFGSEIKAILASGLISPMLSRKSLIHYLHKGYINPHTTIYENIYTLPPGHYLTVTPGQNPETRKYWNLPESTYGFDFEKALEEFSFLFDKAVSSQLIADVQVSAFLSGGLDSSSVVSRAIKYNPNIRPITFEFEKDSELLFAKALANHLNFDLEVLKSGRIDFGKELLKLMRIMDEPFADPSIIPTFLICKLAADKTKVALTGDGADELLGGYDYWYSNLDNIYKKRNQGIKTSDHFRFFAKLILNSTIQKGRYTQNIEHLKFMRGSIYNKHIEMSKIHDGQYSFFSWIDINHLTGFNNSPEPVAYLFKEKDAGLRYDLINYLPGDILVKSDRCSMACGLELRAPFLDKELAEFCISLPYEFKRLDGKSKRILRAVMEVEWPALLKNRPKQGFSMSYESWMKETTIQALWQNLVSSKFKVFESIGIEPRKITSRKLKAKQQWNLLSLALWIQRHV